MDSILENEAHSVGVKRERDLQQFASALGITFSEAPSPARKLRKIESPDKSSSVPLKIKSSCDEQVIQVIITTPLQTPDIKPSLGSLPLRSSTNFQNIRIKKESEILSSTDDDESEDEQEQKLLTPPLTSSDSSSPPHSSSSSQATPSLIQLGREVFFTARRNSNSETDQTPAGRPMPSRTTQPRFTDKSKFCYNCKRYGHFRRECRNHWHYWWPVFYTRKYSWLTRRVRIIRNSRRNGKMSESEYRQAIRKTEDEVEAAEQQSQYRNPNFTPFMNRENGPTIRRPKFLQAHRRCSPPPPLFSVQTGFNFDNQRLIANLQQQVEQLRLTLLHLNPKSLSPPSVNQPQYSCGRY